MKQINRRYCRTIRECRTWHPRCRLHCFDGLNSAIYFTGPHLTKERIQNLTLKTNSNQTLQNVKRRTEWVHHLKNNTRDTTQADEDRMKTVFKWAKQPISYDALFARTNQYIRLSPKRNQPKHKNKKHA